MKKLNSSQSSHQLVPFIILILIAGLISADIYFYFKAHKDIPTQQLETTPVDTTAGWKTYINTTLKYSIKYPPTVSVEEIHSESDNYVTVGSVSIWPWDGKKYDNEKLYSFHDITINGVPGKQSSDGHNTTIQLKSGSSGVTLQWRMVEDQKNLPIVSTFRFTDDISDWQTYANYDLGFQIDYPADRLPIEIHPDNTTEHIVFGDILHDPFTIDVKNNTTIDGYISQDFKDNPSCANRKTIKLNSYDAVFYTCENEFAGVTVDNFVIAKDNNIYIINFMLAPQGTTAENVKFVIAANDQKMLDSFRFTDDMSDWKIYKNEKFHYQIQLPTGWWINEQKDFTQILPPSIKKEDLPSGAGFGGAQSDQPIITISRVVDLELGETIHNIQDERKITIDSIESSQRQENGSFGNSINTYIPQGKSYIKFSWDLISTPSDPILDQILSTFKFLK